MWPLVVTTPAPCFKKGTIREIPFPVIDGKAMMGLPPLDKAAPLIKSICPPMPEY